MKDYRTETISYYKSFAEAMQKKFMQLRFGVKSCIPVFDVELSTIQKELSDWQKNNDEGFEKIFNVDAGSSDTIVLPKTTLTLTAKVFPSNTELESISWTQISGPNTAFITDRDKLTTSVAGLIEGMYTFSVTVESLDGSIATDIVSKTVMYVYPKANAGPDIKLIQPNNSGTLTGQDIQGSYPILSRIWSKVSGPTLGTISSSGDYSNLIIGNYVFRKTVTDINGRTNYDEMTLSMKAASITVNYGWSASDPYMNLVAGIPFTFQKTISVADDQDLVLDFSTMPPFQYPVIEIPASYEIKNYYIDSGSQFNQDVIPGDHFRSTFVVSGKRYYTTYGTESFSSGSNDRVTFSKQF